MRTSCPKHDQINRKKLQWTAQIFWGSLFHAVASTKQTFVVLLQLHFVSCLPSSIYSVEYLLCGVSVFVSCEKSFIRCSPTPHKRLPCISNNDGGNNRLPPASCSSASSSFSNPVYWSHGRDGRGIFPILPLALPSLIVIALRGGKNSLLLWPPQQTSTCCQKQFRHVVDPRVGRQPPRFQVHWPNWKA